MSKTDELRAALAVAELEDELAAAKDSDMDPDDYRDLKLRLREARQTHREQRDTGGDGVASPDSIDVTTEVHS